MKLITSILLFYSLLVNSTSVCGQQNDSIQLKVIVKDSVTQMPLDYVTIRLQCTSDNVLDGSITSSQGIAVVTLENRACLINELLASRSGYTAKKLLFRQNDSLFTGAKEIKINLVAFVKQLKEVIISANTITKELNKLIYRIRETDFLKGSKVMDIINRVPSLSTNSADQVFIKGRIPADVYLEGKIVTPDILKTLPIEAIKQIEIIDNPDASFSGEASGGIVNLILKNNKDLSGGSVTASSGLVRQQYMGNGNFMFSNKKLFVLLASSAQFSVQKKIADVNRNASSENTTLSQHNLIQSDVMHYYVNGELFYKPDSTSQISTILNTSLTKFDSYGNSMNNIVKNNLATNNTALAYRYNYKNQFWGSTMEYKKDLNAHTTIIFTGGYQFTPKLMSINNKERSSLYFATNNLFFDTTEGNHYSAQVVLTGKNDLSKIFEWEGGLVYHQEKSKDKYSQLNQQSNESYLVNAGNTDRLIFDKKISAAYFLANSTIFKKYQLSLGTRLEYYQVFLQYAMMREQTYRQFYNVLPSLSVLQNLKSGHTLGLNYSRKTTRPDVSILSRFNYGTGRTLINGGNSNLIPELTDKLSLSLSKFNEGKYYDLTLYGGLWSHPIFETTINSTPDSSVTREFYNFKRYTSGGISYTFLLPVKETITLNGTLYSEIFHLADKQPLTQKHSGIIWGLTANVNVALKNKMNASADLSYTSYDYEYQETTKNYPMISLSFQKLVFKDRFSFSVSWMDVLGKGFDHRGKYEDGRISQLTRERGKNNNILFGVTYNFGKNLTNSNKQKEIITDEIKEREHGN